jgi:hypothetical protein
VCRGKLLIAVALASIHLVIFHDAAFHALLKFYHALYRCYIEVNISKLYERTDRPSAELTYMTDYRLA